MNYVLSAKVEKYMQTLGERDPEIRKDRANTELLRLLKLNEKDCYIEIPVAWLRSDLFGFYLEKVPVDTLESFGLENGMKHPNFKAVRSLLNKKFNFSIDDNQENNPLKSI